MSKTISRQNNNKIRTKNNLSTKEKDYNLKKYGKKDFIRVKKWIYLQKQAQIGTN